MRKVMHNETLKPLDVGIIYPISYSHWGSPMQVMPKKGCSTVVPNDKGELIPNCTVTKKVHLPLLFIDQCWNVSKGQVLLFSRWDVRILSDSDGTRRSRDNYLQVPFGLCNASVTFQRCMAMIFGNLLEDVIEAFMDDC